MLYRNSSMTPQMIHKAAMHRILIQTDTDVARNRSSDCVCRMQILPIVLMFLVLVVPMVRAEAYEVLVVAIAGANEIEKIDEFEKVAAKFNSLPSKGYSSARPYFNVLHMANGQVYFVFGFKGDVQGVHRRNYPGTIENLHRMKHKGAPKYPQMHWLPVSKIRRMFTVPQ